MADRLFLERECEHGKIEEHWFDPYSGRPGISHFCSGGERREVVVDYEAALAEFLTWHENERVNGAHRTMVEYVVRAALGLTEEGTQQ